MFWISVLRSFTNVVLVFVSVILLSCVFWITLLYRITFLDGNVIDIYSDLFKQGRCQLLFRKIIVNVNAFIQ